MKRFALFLPLVALSLGSVAQAGSRLQGPLSGPVDRLPIAVDGTWIVLDEVMSEGNFYAPTYTYNSATPIQIDVTDLFVVSDQNEVYLDGLLAGTTPLLPDWQSLFPAVGPLDPPYTTDPDVAWGTPEFSKQSFVLPAGTHMLTFRNIHIPLDQDGDPFADGTMAFRLVPEPTSALLFALGGAFALRRRRGLHSPVNTARAHRTYRTHRRGAGLAAGMLAAFTAFVLTPNFATAAPCGTLTADVLGGVLQIDGTAGADSIRVTISSSNPAVIEVYSPATAGSPSCTYDSTATPFATIRVSGAGDDDLIVIDDSQGPVSDGWTIEIDGGDGADTVLGGIDLNAVPLANAMLMIATLQQARDLIDDVLDLLDASGSGCSTVPCLVTNTASVLESAGSDLVVPTAEYVRDIESELVQPSAQAVRDAHDRIANYLQTFLANDAQSLSADAQTLTTNVEVMVDEFELLLPVAQDLLARAEILYAHASSMGMNAQSGDSVQVFTETVESHVISISEFADLCAEDPEPTETEFDEDLQDPSGLPPACAEVERRTEALEVITDDVEAYVDQVEVEGDTFEADGDAFEIDADALGDDENPSSSAAQIEAEGDQLVLTGDAFAANADALNADWENWVGTVESDLEGRGALMDGRGQTEVLGAANTLQAQTQADVEAAADALRVEADQILADLDAIILVAAPLLRDDLARAGGGCPVTPTHTVSGGPGNDVLIGTTGSDLLQGGAGTDLLIGAGGADRLEGEGGSDLLFGGGGADELRGGDDIDVIVGNKGDDCLFGGGGQTVTRGSLSVELGDLFFGVDGNDSIVAGNSESDDPTEIDVAFGGKDNDTVRVSHGGTLTVGSFSFKLGNLVFGGPGDDNILTKDGVDVIFGGTEADTITTGKGDVLTIGSGSSAFRLDLGDLIFGGDGDDTIHSDDPDADRADDDIDVVFGGNQNDTIHGYGGGDLTIGDLSDPDFEIKLGNLIFGGDNDDAIDTLDGIDVIFGGNDVDTISTAKGALLTIGSGSNEFRLALGDLIFGGDGDDTIDSDDPDGDRADDDIDVVFGGNQNDTINGYGGGMLSIGDSSDPDFELRLGNVIFGGDNDDEIVTLDGIDLIFCGSGDDTASAGKGHNLEIDSSFSIDLGDLMFGQTGADTLHGDAADPPDSSDNDGIDVIFGGPGNDGEYGGTGGTIEVPDQNFCLLFGNLLFGGPDDDTLRGDYLNWDTNNLEGGIDLAFGAAGNDTIEGSAGTLIVVGDITSGQAIIIGFGNLLFGGPDNDTIKGADDASLCTGESQDLDDLLNNLGITELGGAADLIFAGAGDDIVEAYDGIDFVFGSDGDDVMSGENGGILIVPISGVPTPIAFGNLMFGNDGDDTIDSLGRLLMPTVPPMEIDLLFGGPCYDDISAGDGLNLVFGNKADDTIDAGDGINLLFGNSGEDEINTGTGLNLAFGNSDNDEITADDGINVLFGNRGNDLVTGGNGLNIGFGNKGNDIVQAGFGIAVLFGNAGVDVVQGGDGLSVAFGNKGDDQVSGGNGLSVLFGNKGNDEVTGANGLCVGFGNADHDIVSAGAGLAVLFGNAGDDRVQTGPGLSVLFGNRDNDILQGGNGLYIGFGNNDSDVIVGGGGLNLEFGNRGDDQFFGGSGVNIMFGNRDSDILRGGGSVDFLFGNQGVDQVAGNGSKDFIFGNKENDSLVTDGNGDFAFGNRGGDTVRSGGDGSSKDYLFGNRGNDSLYGCDNSDKLFGGRGSDSKDRNNCDGLSLSPPARGEVRGTVMIDVDGDGFGDVGQAGVTVTAGSGSAVTDADGNYRIAGLAVGGYTVAQTVPGGYTQVSLPPTYSVTINSMGIDLYQDRDFVNREECYVSPDAWECLGTVCSPQPSELECRPIVVRRVMRCPDTGEICDETTDCPCSDCIPSWAVEECACVNPNTDCFIVLTTAGPQCGSECVAGGEIRPCELVWDGDLVRCVCSEPPCPTELARFTFSGVVQAVLADNPLPAPWNNVIVGSPWTVSYRFARYTADNDGSSNTGNYPAIVSYQLQIGQASTSGTLVPSQTYIRNLSNPGSGDVYNAYFQVAAGGPPSPEFLLLLEDPTGTAWTLAGLNPRDALPLCGDIDLSRHSARFMRFGVNLPGIGWSIIGSVENHSCTNCAQGFSGGGGSGGASRKSPTSANGGPIDADNGGKPRAVELP